MKNPPTSAGIEPATFRFVAQHLNHCATAVPSSAMKSGETYGSFSRKMYWNAQNKLVRFTEVNEHFQSLHATNYFVAYIHFFLIKS